MRKDFNTEVPQNWKWGIFYFNSKDSRLIAPKRIKSLGWTLNFAPSSVWIGLFLILVLLVIVKQLSNQP